MISEYFVPYFRMTIIVKENLLFCVATWFWSLYSTTCMYMYIWSISPWECTWTFPLHFCSILLPYKEKKAYETTRVCVCVRVHLHACVHARAHMHILFQVLEQLSFIKFGTNMIPIQSVLTPHILIFTICNNKWWMQDHMKWKALMWNLCSGHKKSYTWQHLNKPNW